MVWSILNEFRLKQILEQIMEQYGMVQIQHIIWKFIAYYRDNQENVDRFTTQHILFKNHCWYIQ